MKVLSVSNSYPSSQIAVCCSVTKQLPQVPAMLSYLQCKTITLKPLAETNPFSHCMLSSTPPQGLSKRDSPTRLCVKSVGVGALSTPSSVVDALSGVQWDLLCLHTPPKSGYAFTQHLKPDCFLWPPSLRLCCTLCSEHVSISLFTVP